MKTNLFILIIVLCSGSVLAQQQLKIADFTSDNKFSTKSVRGIRWMNEGAFYTALKNNDIIKYDLRTGQEVETILDASTLDLSGSLSDYEFSDDEQQILLLTDRKSIYRRSYTAVYYVYNRQTKALTKLAKGRQAYCSFSPDGTKVAFTRDNNLFYVNLSNFQEVQITQDGERNKIINGHTDWVYEEELSLTKAFAWSPDSKKIAFYRFDESDVREYNLQKWNQGQLYPEDYRYKYPKAGEDNSVVEIKIFELETKNTVPVDLGTDKDIYIPRITWTKSPEVLSVRRLNRLQNTMQVLHISATTGKGKPIITDKSDSYVNVEELVYLDDGKHIITTSESSGFRHIYLYDIDGKLIRPITSGNWEVKAFYGVDQSSRKGKVYYTSHEESPLEQHFYSIDISGKGKRKLSLEAGVNTVNLSNDFKYYINYHSNNTSVNRVELFDTKSNKRIKVLEDNQELEKAVGDYGLVSKEFFELPIEDGTKLNGYMLKPKDFSETTKYPVLMFQYSGPGSQQVSNSFGGGHFYWHQLLVQKGYLVVVIDGRGTGGRGADFKKQTYKQLGKLEVEDQIAGAKYLSELSYVDKARIGIWGWSYGGYMSSLAILRGADVFSMAIAVAPVTSWRYYDTIYTERYLAKPQDNASGYDDNSPATYAANLKGSFLLIHGTGDDNVHFQNSVALADALIANGKQFDSFYYPDRAHGIRANGGREHIYHLMTDYVLNNL
jgi:dipeptidyl-peptidase-4